MSTPRIAAITTPAMPPVESLLVDVSTLDAIDDTGVNDVVETVAEDEAGADVTVSTVVEVEVEDDEEEREELDKELDYMSAYRHKNKAIDAPG